MLVLAEDLPVTITYRRLREPGVYALWRREWARGAIAITDGRLVVWADGFLHVRTPHGHPLRARIQVVADSADSVRLTYWPAPASGVKADQVEVRIRTGQAGHIADLLNRLAARD